MGCFGARLRIVCGPNDALDGIAEYDIRDLIMGKECANQCATVDCDDEHSFWLLVLARAFVKP